MEQQIFGTLKDELCKVAETNTPKEVTLHCCSVPNISDMYILFWWFGVRSAQKCT